MDEKTAWKNFTHTGLVQDYLEYSKIKSHNTNRPLEDIEDADKYGWSGYNGKNHR